MRTIDLARDSISNLSADSPPDVVLQAFKQEIQQLEETAENGPNPPRRAGAQRKLKEFRPWQPVLEVEAALAELEANVKAQHSAAQRATIRVQSAHLKAQIEQLPVGEEREIFAHWLDELFASENSAPVPPPAPEDPYRELIILIERHEHNVASTPRNLHELDAEQTKLQARLDHLPAAPAQASARQRLDKTAWCIANLRAQEEIEALLVPLQASAEQDGELRTIETQLAGVAERIAGLPPSPERATLESRIQQIRASIGARRQHDEAAAMLHTIRRACATPKANAAVLKERAVVAERLVQSLPTGLKRDSLEKATAELHEHIANLAVEPPLLPPHQAVYLRLQPINEAPTSQRPLTVITRPHFTIGRKPAEGTAKADLLTPTAEKRISRIHATLAKHQGRITIISGEDGRPSTNAAKLNGALLTATPVPLDPACDNTLDLAGVLALQIRHLAGNAAGGPPLDEAILGMSGGATLIMPAISGCLRFRPIGADQLPQNTIWLFTDASIGSGSTCAITISGLAAEHARLHYWRNSFWIESLSASATVLLDNRPLAPVVAHPLRSGQELRLGTFRYTVELA
ncbi:MAG: FHA domain protein [Betaproteobacteria bacterium ADurb.Bin341]|nr:MAG: FHA domain protein [Betaproteobacteria bacterium ADurb.Bin341]